VVSQELSTPTGRRRQRWIELAEALGIECRAAAGEVEAGLALASSTPVSRTM
jgi:hypothetical protein